MATAILIPHDLSSPWFLGRPRLLTRISRLPGERDISSFISTLYTQPVTPLRCPHSGAFFAKPITGFGGKGESAW